MKITTGYEQDHFDPLDQPILIGIKDSFSPRKKNMQYALKKRLFAFIAENIGLEVLDLSWNRFRGKSTVEIVDGIKVFVHFIHS